MLAAPMKKLLGDPEPGFLSGMHTAGVVRC